MNAVGGPIDDRRGFALVTVLLVLAILSVIGAEFALSMRLEASMVRAYKDAVVAEHLAEAGVEAAIREILSDASFVSYADDGLLTFYRSATEPLPRLPRQAVALGPGHFSYRITDEESRIDLNLASAEKVDRLLRLLGIEKADRDVIVDSIQDWKDPNEEHRLNGAESEDTYLNLPIPYRARNANFDDVRELLQIHGMTPEIYAGRDRTSGVREFVTARGGAQVNINTAPELVLKAHALSDAEVSYVTQTRRVAPFPSVPGQLVSRGFGVASRTFRIEAEGRIAGEPRAWVTAIVQKRANPNNGEPEVVVLSWNPDPERTAGTGSKTAP